MTASIAQPPTVLDDAIIRNAEATLETVARAREAIHSGSPAMLPISGSAIPPSPTLPRKGGEDELAFPALDRSLRVAVLSEPAR